MVFSLALVGNPNCGKTTLFNTITGSRQYVGNWPGVTVEKKVGKAVNTDCDIIDLPGVYSLSPYSAEEIVARDCVLSDAVQGIINIIDGTNIERNLYLTTQLLELKKPMVIAINMMDELQSHGEEIDCPLMSALLGAPVVPISAKKRINIDKLIKLAQKQAEEKSIPGEIFYDFKTQTALNNIAAVVAQNNHNHSLPIIFCAAKLLEKDDDIQKKLRLTDKQNKEISGIISRYEDTQDSDEKLANARYDFITKRIVNETVIRPALKKRTVTQIIDAVALNRILAIPIFAVIMVCVFSLTFGPIGAAAQEQLAFFFENTLSNTVKALLSYANAPDWTYGLLIDAIIGGIGGVLSFIPQITILFFCLSLLEDSGYIARAALIMDCLFEKIGLSGKSFIPMLMGFGCTTPAVMAARTMESEHERRMTILLTPFMSCSARLTIYALFAGVFFKEHSGLVVCSIYLIGILAAVFCGLILKKTLFKNASSPFVLELPPYRIPSLKTLLGHVLERVKGFIVKAGTLIFSMSVVIWLCQNLSLGLRPVENPRDSILGVIGAAVLPAFAPLGFGSWEAAVSLFTGLVAKESVVSTLSVLLSGRGTLEQSLLQIFTPLSAYSFMVFTLLYLPCISAFAAVRREMNSAKWTAATVIIELISAYLVSALIYQIGTLVLGVLQ